MTDNVSRIYAVPYKLHNFHITVKMELGKNNNQVPTEQALHITNVMLSLPDIRNKTNLKYY